VVLGEAPGAVITWSAHLSMLYAASPDRDRPALARAAGFRTVDSWWLEDEADTDPWMAAVESERLNVALLNCPAGDVRAGARGRLNIPEAEAEVLTDIDRSIAVAARVGARSMNLLTGIEVSGCSRADQLRQAAGIVGEATRRAAASGIRMLLEPLNTVDVPGYLICDVPGAIEVIELSGEAVGVLYDVYHTARAGRDPIAEIASYASLIGHVHYADHPGRGGPGTGSLDLSAIVDALLAAGYDGSIGLEFDPAGFPLAELHDRLPLSEGVARAGTEPLAGH